jgi:hypothetical protein
MAVTHETAVRNTIADAVVDLVDTGTASPNLGYIEFQTSGDVEVATLTFANPAFGAAASGTATANAITSDTNATGGTVAKFAVYDSDGTKLFSGSVTATSASPQGDITLSSVSVGASDTVSMSSLTYSAPS